MIDENQFSIVSHSLQHCTNFLLYLAVNNRHSYTDPSKRLGLNSLYHFLRCHVAVEKKKKTFQFYFLKRAPLTRASKNGNLHFADFCLLYLPQSHKIILYLLQKWSSLSPRHENSFLNFIFVIRVESVNARVYLVSPTVNFAGGTVIP